jgi:hypothetical protein
VTKSSNHTLSLHRLTLIVLQLPTSRGSSLPTTDSILILVLCCTPLYSHSLGSVLLQLLNFQFQFSIPLATDSRNTRVYMCTASGRTPWETRFTCYEEYVFMSPLPSTGSGADHIENTCYCCEVFSARCVATSAEWSTENTAPLSLAACLFERVYLATGFPGSIA